MGRKCICKGEKEQCQDNLSMRRKDRGRKISYFDNQYNYKTMGSDGPYSQHTSTYNILMTHTLQILQWWQRGGLAQ